MKLYHAYDQPPKVRMSDWGESRTRQSEAAALDINNIMKKYEKTGVLPVIGREGFFADVSQMPDYRGALESVRLADEVFMELPAGVRSKFQNDAAEFLDFCSNPDNRDEMVEMGLLEAPDVALEVPAEVPEVVKEVVTEKGVS